MLGETPWSAEATGASAAERGGVATGATAGTRAGIDAKTRAGAGAGAGVGAGGTPSDTHAASVFTLPRSPTSRSSASICLSNFSSVRCPPPLHKTGNRASSYSHHAHSAVNSKSLFECDSGTARHELCCAAGCAHPRINPSQPVGLKFCCIMRGIMPAPRDQHIDMMPQSAKTMRVKQQSVVVKRTNFMLHSVVQFKTAVCTAHNHPATSAR